MGKELHGTFVLMLLFFGTACVTTERHSSVVSSEPEGDSVTVGLGFASYHQDLEGQRSSRCSPFCDLFADRDLERGQVLERQFVATSEGVELLLSSAMFADVHNLVPSSTGTSDRTTTRMVGTAALCVAGLGLATFGLYSVEYGNEAAGWVASLTSGVPLALCIARMLGL